MQISRERDALWRDYRAMGVAPGDKLVIQTSFKSLGLGALSPDAFIQATLDYLTPEGLLLVPTHTNSFAVPEGIAGASSGPPFHKAAPTRLGAVPSVFLLRPDAVRSGHPTHSCAAIGKGAEELLAEHTLFADAFGRESPFYKLSQSGGKHLLIGCGHISNSFLHVAEYIAELPYLRCTMLPGWGLEFLVQGEDGSVSRFETPGGRMPGDSAGFIKHAARFEALGLVKRARLHSAQCLFTPDMNALLEYALELLARDPFALLCDNLECRCCTRRREYQRGYLAAMRAASSDIGGSTDV